MKSKLTIHDIAKMAGVGVGTVSRVINDHPDVSDSMREKISSIINESGYIPNNSARSLKRDAIKGIGVVVMGFSNPFFITMMEVIQKELRENGYLMFIEPVDPARETDEVEAAMSLVTEKKLRGVIFLGGNLTPHAQKLSKLDVPFVTVTTTIEEGMDEALFSSVLIDDYMEAKKLGDRIVAAGHRRIAVVGFRTPGQPVSGNRISGFLDAMQAHGITVTEGFNSNDGDFSMETGYRAGKQVLGEGEVTCLFCHSDTIALGAMRAVYDLGLRVPEDVSIIGFDGIPATRYAVPTIATVKQPSNDMAKASVELLLKHIRSKAPHRHLVMDATFREGQSFMAYEKK